MLGDLSDPYAVHRAEQWLKTELARYTYKPNFTFEVMPADARTSAPFEPGWYYTMPSIRITATLPDSRRETPVVPHVLYQDEVTGAPRLKTERRLIPISMTVTPPHYFVEEPDDFARWFSGVLQDFECHESREWLRRDGEIYDDPHAEGARR